MVNQLPVGSNYSHQKYLFTATDVGNASGTLVAAQAGAVSYQIPWGGSVVGVSWYATGTVGGTLTTGTLTPLVMVNGSALTPFPNVADMNIHVNSRGGYVNQDAQLPGYIFPQGATLGLVYSKSGTVEPTTLDLTAEVWVLLQDVDY